MTRTILIFIVIALLLLKPPRYIITIINIIVQPLCMRSWWTP